MNKSKTISITINKVISLLLALYLLNFSIDSKDLQPDYLPEDRAYNDIESFYEFFLEIILDIEDAVAENDEQDPDEGGSIQFSKFYHGAPISEPMLNKYLVLKDFELSSAYNFILSSSFIEIDSPPPRV